MLDYINNIASTPLFVGIMTLILNIGSRHIIHEFSNNDEEYRQNILLRRITIFVVCFMATKDIILSVILTSAFVIISGGLFRGKSDYSREGFDDVRNAAGLKVVDYPAYDADIKKYF